VGRPARASTSECERKQYERYRNYRDAAIPHIQIGDEVFATDVAKVREVLDFTTITKIPRTPDFMSGVINLRGNVVPVVDLRLCFEMSKTEKTVNTCIVVVEMLVDGESTVIGALADSVEEVIDLEPEQISRRPDRHADPDRLHQGHGQARRAIHHDPGYRPRFFRRGTGGGPRAKPANRWPK
jgi:chemotaxis signal transduction protein